MKKILLFIFLILVGVGSAFGAEIGACQNIVASGYYNLTGNIDTGGGTCIHIQVSDVELDCNGYEISNSGGATTGVEATSVDNITIHNCQFLNFDSEAINFANSSNTVIYDSYFDQNYQHINSGFFTGENTIKSGLLIYDNIFDDTTQTGPGLILYNDENVQIINNQFIDDYNGSVAISFSSQTAGDFDNIVITGNTFVAPDKTTSRAIYFSDDQQMVVNDLLIQNNNFSYYYDGIVLTSIGGTYYQNATLKDNNFHNTSRIAITAYSLYNSLIESNEAVNLNDYYGDAYKYDIRTSNNITVFENECTGGDINDVTYCYRARDSNNVSFISNTAVNVWAGFDCRDSNNCYYELNEIVNANKLDIFYGGTPLGIRLRGTTSGHTILNNEFTNCNNSIELRSGSVLTNTLIGNNTITNSLEIGINFNDATFDNTFVVRQNNFLQDTTKLGGTTASSITIEQNYYQGYSNLVYSNGSCVYNIYTENSLTGTDTYCCESGWNLGCTQKLPSQTYTGDTTDFANEPDPTNVSNATLEKSNTKVIWQNNVNAYNVDFDTYFILNDGIISIDTDNVNETFDSAADVTMNLANVNGVDCASFELYYADNFYSTISDISSNGELIASADNVGGNCVDSSVCQNVECTGNVLTFEAQHFDGFALIAAEATASCQATKTTIFAAFGLLAVAMIVLSAFGIINIFRNDISTGALIAIAVGIISLSVIIMVGYIVVSSVGSAIC